MDWEKSFGELKLSDLKLESFSLSINQVQNHLKLTHQWKKIYDHLNFVRDSVVKAANELHFVQESKEKELEGVRESLEQKRGEIEVKEKELEGIRESLEQKRGEIEVKEKVLEGIRESLEQKRGEIEVKEKELGRNQETLEQKRRAIEVKDQELRRNQESLEHKRRAVEVKDQKLGRNQESLEQKRRAVELKEEEVKKIRESIYQTRRVVEGKRRAIEAKEKELGRNQETLEQKRRVIEVKEKELRRNQESLEQKRRAIEVKDQELRRNQESLEQKRRAIEVKDQELRRNQESLEHKRRAVEVKDQKLGRNQESLEQKRRAVELKEEEVKKSVIEVEEKEKGLEKSKELVERRRRENEVKDRELQELQESLMQRLARIEEEGELVKQALKDVEAREKEFDQSMAASEPRFQASPQVCERTSKRRRKRSFSESFERCKGKSNDDRTVGRMKQTETGNAELDPQECEEQVEEGEMQCQAFRVKVRKIESDDPCANLLIISRFMDGNALQVFLNENNNFHDKMRGEVCNALRSASDPAKLVLDAMEGFYPPHLKMGDVEFEEGVVKRSCIFLLEELMNISPKVKPNVRDEALKVASDWSRKMRVETGNDSDALGFLLLLASYGLASAFRNDKLLNYLEIVADSSLLPGLFRALKLEDNISGVTDFVQELIGKNKIVQAIKCIHAFGLISEFPLGPLFNAFLNESKASEEMIRNCDTVEAKIEATNKRVADLTMVMKCIEVYDSGCDQFSTYELKKHIDILEEFLRA